LLNIQVFVSCTTLIKFVNLDANNALINTQLTSF